MNWLKKLNSNYSKDVKRIGFHWKKTTLIPYQPFDSKQKKRSFYKGKDCIKMFSIDLKELGIKIINYEQKEMMPLTYNENKFYEE